MADCKPEAERFSIELKRCDIRNVLCETMETKIFAFQYCVSIPLRIMQTVIISRANRCSLPSWLLKYRFTVQDLSDWRWRWWLVVFQSSSQSRLRTPDRPDRLKPVADWESRDFTHVVVMWRSMTKGAARAAKERQWFSEAESGHSTSACYYCLYHFRSYPQQKYTQMAYAQCEDRYFSHHPSLIAVRIVGCFRETTSMSRQRQSWRGTSL